MQKKLDALLHAQAQDHTVNQFAIHQNANGTVQNLKNVIYQHAN
jgi:hypothetical protein